ncbi:hypothetical protein PLESTB_000891200 [Pleodorina starrii]|uniref:FAS1 domain-containing protein n=2 Tax=Pleodorina starrii TaxID=330485 RepID=A0A9W6BM04_9CHLO|nr:hypothetical protein PLESTB_000891200 [Pleodorina starrii]
MPPQALLGALALLGLKQEDLQRNPRAFASLLLYHAVQPPATSAAIIAAGQQAEWDCAFDPYASEGDSLGTNRTATGVTVASLGSDANVTTADIMAGKSVVHVIDAVLMPFFPSSAVAIQRVRVASMLANLITTYAPSFFDLLGPTADYSVLVPFDPAFTSDLSGNSSLLRQLTSSPSGVMYLLKYHVVPKIANLSADVSTDPKTLTTLSGLKLKLVRGGGEENFWTALFPGGNATIFSVAPIGLLPDGTHRTLLYFIDQVLIPPAMNTLQEALGAHGDATTLIAALNATTVYNATLANSSSFKGTILVPTDAAFNTYLSSKGLTAAALLANQAALKTLLDLHVIPNATLVLSTLTNGTKLTTNKGPDTLSVTRAASGGVTFTVSNSGSSAKALGYESSVGTSNTTTLIFIDAVLSFEAANVGEDGGAATYAGPSPLTMLLCSLFAAALLQLFGRQ